MLLRRGVLLRDTTRQRELYLAGWSCLRRRLRLGKGFHYLTILPFDFTLDKMHIHKHKHTHESILIRFLPSLNYFSIPIYVMKLTGSGFYNWPDGSIFNGSILDGLRHGEGQYTCSAGQFYEGEWYFVIILFFLPRQ